MAVTADRHITMLPRQRRLWACWGLAIIAWILHLAVSYALVEWFCRNPEATSERMQTVLLHSVSLFCLALALVGAYLAWGTYKLLQHGRFSAAETAVRRSRFMARFGLWISLFFALVIAVEAIPNFVVPPCL